MRQPVFPDTAPCLSGICCAVSLCIALLSGCSVFTADTGWDLSSQEEADYLYLRYEDARRTNQTQEALELLTELLDIEPRAHFYLDYAALQWQDNDIAPVVHTLQKGLKQFPDSRELVHALCAAYVAQEKTDTAIATLEKFLQAHPVKHTGPGNEILYKELALLYNETKQYPKALKALQNIPHKKRSPDILYTFALINAAMGNAKEAIVSLHKAIAKAPDFLDAWAALAFQYELASQYHKAQQTYRRILEKNSALPEITLRLIRVHLKLNEPEAAFAVYKAAPHSTGLSLEAATLFLETRHYEQARTLLNSLARQPDIAPRVWFYLAMLAYEGDKDTRQALAWLERVPPDSTYYDRALRFQVFMLLELGQTDVALQRIRKSQQASPDNPQYWLLEAELYKQQKQFEQARQTLERALQQWPDTPPLLYALGSIFEYMQQRHKSMPLMERILVLDPDHSDALNYVGYTLAEENRDLPRALALIQKALTLSPGQGYIIDSLAWVYFRRGEYTRAWESINQAIEQTADDPTIWEHYGDIARALHKEKKAAQGYQNSLELKPDNPAVQKKLDAL